MRTVKRQVKYNVWNNVWNKVSTDPRLVKGTHQAIEDQIFDNIIMRIEGKLRAFKIK